MQQAGWVRHAPVGVDRSQARGCCCHAAALPKVWTEVQAWASQQFQEQTRRPDAHIHLAKASLLLALEEESCVDIHPEVRELLLTMSDLRWAEVYQTEWFRLLYIVIWTPTNAQIDKRATTEASTIFQSTGQTLYKHITYSIGRYTTRSTQMQMLTHHHTCCALVLRIMWAPLRCRVSTNAGASTWSLARLDFLASSVRDLLMQPLLQDNPLPPDSTAQQPLQQQPQQQSEPQLQQQPQAEIEPLPPEIFRTEPMRVLRAINTVLFEVGGPCVIHVQTSIVP